jgi:beta-glucosidase
VLDFTHSSGSSLPPDTHAAWRGDLSVPEDGVYWLYLQALGGRARLMLDGKPIGRTSATPGGVHGDIQQAAMDNGMPTTDGLDNVRRAVTLTRGTHNLLVDLTPDGSGAPAQIRLNWMTPAARAHDHTAAIDAARHAKTAVVFVWSRRNPVLGLPGEQDKLIEDIAAVNPNTIVVLNTSQPVSMPWLAHVKAVVEMWWPGDEGGWATARVLLGKTDPAGRLPVTFAGKLTDYAANDPAHPERSAAGVNGETHYTEGVLVGYRWFDEQRSEPLFPFGFGLSYTRFAYSDFSAHPLPGGGATLTLRLRNTGAVAGDEVPQIYLDAPSQPIAGAQFAPHTLVAFDRVTLKPGESRLITLHLAPRAFQYWSTAENGWRSPAGPRTLQAGASSRDFRSHTTLTPLP